MMYIYIVDCTMRIVLCILYRLCTAWHMYVLYDIVCVYCKCLLYMYIILCIYTDYTVCVYNIYIYIYIYTCFMFQKRCYTTVPSQIQQQIPYQPMLLQKNEPGWNALSSHWSSSQVGLFKNGAASWVELKMGAAQPSIWPSQQRT